MYGNVIEFMMMIELNVFFFLLIELNNIEMRDYVSISCQWPYFKLDLTSVVPVTK